MSIEHFILVLVLVLFISRICYKKTEENGSSFFVIFLLVAFVALGLGIAIVAYWESRPARMACIFILSAVAMIKIISAIHSRPATKKNLKAPELNEHI